MDWEPEITTIYQMTSALQYRVFWNHDQKLYAERLLEEAHDALETSLFEEDSSDHNEIFRSLEKAIPSKKESKENKDFYITHHGCCKHCAKNFTTDDCFICGPEDFFSYKEIFDEEEKLWEKEYGRREDEIDERMCFEIGYRRSEREDEIDERMCFEIN